MAFSLFGCRATILGPAKRLLDTAEKAEHIS